MFKIEYDLKLDENGFPYIIPNESFDNLPEHKLFIFELSRYYLHELLKGSKKNKMSSEIIFNLRESEKTLNLICVELQDTLKGMFEISGEKDLIFPKQNFNIIVNSVEERNNLNYEGIFYRNKIFKRIEGLKIYVLENRKMYMLKNGIDNKHWVETK